MNEVMQALGRIEGLLESEIALAKEHRDDDKRRFKEVHDILDEHDQEIAKAKGQKSVIVWLAGGGALAVSALVAAAGRFFGKG